MQKVESDMIILGCVRAVKSLSLEVEMPGWMHGIVLIKSVSNEFTKNLNKALDHESNAEQVCNASAMNFTYRVFEKSLPFI